MLSKKMGAISEQAIVLAALKKGYAVSVPIGNCDKYDLILDDGDALLKVQCKTARLDREGRALVFNVASCNGAGIRRYTALQIDRFMVYSPDLDAIYIFPVSIATERGRTWRRIWVKPTRFCKGMLLAKDFLF